MHTHVTQNSSDYRDVPVTALIESSSNPRKRFDENSLSELAASFKTQGVLAPLLVRELDESKYEVIAGARRLRAARLAELKNVPVRIVKLTDSEAIEASALRTCNARTYTRWKKLWASNPSWTSENPTTSPISLPARVKARRTSTVV